MPGLKFHQDDKEIEQKMIQNNSDNVTTKLLKLQILKKIWNCNTKQPNGRQSHERLGDPELGILPFLKPTLQSAATSNTGVPFTQSRTQRNRKQTLLVSKFSLPIHDSPDIPWKCGGAKQTLARTTSAESAGERKQPSATWSTALPRSTRLAM